ncbi:MAG: biopolymer transporter ExbD [Myxococcota bacterium]
MNLKGLQGKGPNGDINVTPLIDVVLVLLIIFMVLTPIIIEEMAVNLPQDKPPPEEPPDKKPLIAAACGDGTFALNRKPLTLPEMGETLKRRLKGKSASKSVIVKGHPDTMYEEIVKLMDTVRDAGAEKVVLSKPPANESDPFTGCEPLAAASPAPATP